MKFMAQQGIESVQHFQPYVQLDPPKSSVQQKDIICVCIKLHSIDYSDSEVENDSSYQCQMTLFSTLKQQFFGCPWVSKPVRKANGKASIEQAVYFYTSSLNQNIRVAIEVIELLQLGKSGRTIAWASVDLDEIKEKLSDSEPIRYRVSFLKGSPVALFFKELDSLAACSGVESTLEIFFHSPLMSLLHLIPENYLCGASDLIPGLYRPSFDYKLTDYDSLSRPQLQKCATIVLKDMTVKVHPSLQEFESEILKRLLDEKQVMDEDLVTNLDISIVQRNIQVGIHNTLCYTQESDSHHMLVEPITFKGFNSSQEEGLVVRSDIKIPNVPDDPNVMIVFVIEYAISMQNQFSEIASRSSAVGRCPSSSVTLLWGSVSLSKLKNKLPFTIDLTNNPSTCPSKTLFLQSMLAYSFELTCLVILDGKKRQTSASTKGMSTRSRSAKLRTSTPINTMALSVPNKLHQLSNSSCHFALYQRSSSHSDLQMSDSSYVEPSFLPSSNSHRTKDDDTSMEEVNVVPSSVALVPASMPMSMGYHLPRTLYAKLFSTQFPAIYDSKGQAPSIIDITQPYNVDHALEMSQSLHGCKIIFQFLAVSGVPSDALPNSLFLTFQFYRFPPLKTEKLFLKNMNSTEEFASSRLVVLSTSLDSKQKLFGYQVTYSIDASELCPNEFKTFLNFLVRGNMCIDLWDASSIMYFGTVILPLKYLCRQSKEAVSATLELHISHSQFPDDAAGPNIPFRQTAKGLLHLRTATVKMPLSPKSLSKLNEITISDSVVVSARSNIINNMHSSPTTISKPNPILDTNRELAKLMASRCSVSAPSESSNLSEERRRKLARMQAVRKSLGIDIADHQATKDMHNYFTQRQRDLQVIESYIEKNKRDMIRSLLLSSITTEKVLYPSLGETAYFEFELMNPFDSNQNIHFSWNCPELSIVTDLREWQTLRNHNGISQKVESVISISDETSPAIFMQPKEKLLVPFQYRGVCINSFHPELIMKASSNHCFSSSLLNVTNCIPAKDVKVTFYNPEKTEVAVLALKIQPLLPISIHHSFRFMSPEYSMFQKALVISGISHRPKVLCSDSEVVCEISLNESNRLTEFNKIILKAPTYAVGKIRAFFIFIYNDKYASLPYQTWQIFIHPVQRIDLSCVAGQTTRSSLILRGNHSSRLVCCFSDTNELQLYPADPFVQIPCTIQELALSIQSLHPGVGYFRVTMVDQNLEEALNLWLIVISCQKPIISKAFQVHLSYGSDAVKKITFMNRSSDAKQYKVLCSHPHLVHVKEQTFTVPGKKKYSIALYFPCQDCSLTETVFLYVCDEFGKTDESFCIKVICK